METLDNLHLRTDWKLAADGLANTGATGPRAIAQRNIYADALCEFSIAPDLTQAAPQYANAYWYLQHGPRPDVSKFAKQYQFWIGREYKDAPQAIESEMQLQEDAIVHNMALQFRYRPLADSSIRWFRFHGKTGVAGTDYWEKLMPWNIFEPDRWHFVRAEYERTFAHDVVFRKLVLRDTEFLLNAVLPAYIAKDSERASYGPKFNNGFQLDLNGQQPPTAYKVYVKDMKVTLE
jgi:hypothetical protein